jgi:hypothetical protein
MQLVSEPSCRLYIQRFPWHNLRSHNRSLPQYSLYNNGFNICRGDQSKMTYLVFQGNDTCDATQKVTRRILGWKECPCVNGGSVTTFYRKRENNIWKVSYQTFLCSYFKSLWIEGKQHIFSCFIISHWLV